MPEIGPAHPLTYRQEIMVPLFRSIEARESCTIVGLASMGKSRLLQFVLRPDVQQHFLAEQAASTLLVPWDGNRAHEISPWGFCELFLTALTEVAGGNPRSLPLRAELKDLRREIIISRDPLLAQRHTELAVRMLCAERGLTLCLVLDEFDEAYRALPARFLASLRALRDANKYRVCYVMVVREHPARLRAVAEVEGFYELFGRSILGLGPYSQTDAKRVLDQVEARTRRPLNTPARAQLLSLSGGHPGLMLPLFNHLAEAGDVAANDGLELALAEAAVQSECRKLWNSLADDERIALVHIAHGMPAAKDALDSLQLKGLVKTEGTQRLHFSPLFQAFVRSQGVPINKQLRVDEATRVVWIGNQPIKNLTATEFELLAYLFRDVGQVRTRDQILQHLHPGEEFVAQDNSVDSLVKRVREKIEPTRERPLYLLTVRGKGYRLLDTPDTDE